MNTNRRLGPSLLTSLAVIALLCLPVTGFAQQNQRAEREKTANEECDSDRRCRLNRLRRKNKARRYVKQVREEELALSIQRYSERKKKEAILRGVKPWNIDFYGVAPVGPGFAAGYTFAGRWRTEAKLFWLIERNIYTSYDVAGTTTYLEGQVDALFVGFNAAYLFRTDWWSPYVAGEALLGNGKFGSYYYYDNDFFGEGSTYAGDLETSYHVVGGAAGFDLQSDFGLRGRIGVTFRYPIFVQAKSGNTIDRASREGLKAWFNEDMRLALEVSMGLGF